MTARSHLLIAGASGATLSLCAGHSMAWIALVAFAAASAGLAPDIDHPNSRSATSLGVFSRGPAWVIHTALGHRGGTHSLCVVPVLALLIVLLGRVLGVAQTSATLLAASIAYGYTTHLVLDWLTPSGIPLFWPFTKRRYHAPLTMRTGSTWERGFTLLVLFMCGVLAIGRYAPPA